MSDMTNNAHGTAIVVDGTGLFFCGPSGCGKSGLAFDCLAEATLRGLPNALVADDQVLLARQNERIVARRPDAIRGLMELRYSGIVAVNSVEEAELHFAILPVNADGNMRLPPENERLSLTPEIDLPVIRVPFWSRFPLALIFAQIATMQAKRS
ncbi:HPr kinase/phosphorylase [Rhizobium sp. AG855]|uniref:HPr kinase/phosphorylase n=1 Tax=Rhizobium sp. AG855 TaxID=2183898 RepID=UPI000E75BC3E|nr:HPr kinase/phosphorylase [Rhizobium sp. AG855]RKE79838.1 Hpr(Ser) kinase/phosphatase [Rhizobium sp. AG855]